MSDSKSIFGPARDQVWRQIADEIGGEYIDGSFWDKGLLCYQYKDWTFLLDTFSRRIRDSQLSKYYTRLRVPIANRDQFYFSIRRKGMFDWFGKLIGLQDVEIGDHIFDDAFVIKANYEARVKELLSSAELRQLIESIGDGKLEVKEDEGAFLSKFPEGVDVLEFEVIGVMKNTVQLKALFDLFCLILDRLVQLDSAYKGPSGYEW